MLNESHPFPVIFVFFVEKTTLQLHPSVCVYIYLFNSLFMCFDLLNMIIIICIIWLRAFHFFFLFMFVHDFVFSFSRLFGCFVFVVFRSLFISYK